MKKDFLGWHINEITEYKEKKLREKLKKANKKIIILKAEIKKLTKRKE